MDEADSPFSTENFTEISAHLLMLPQRLWQPENEKFALLVKLLVSESYHKNPRYAAAVEHILSADGLCGGKRIVSVSETLSQTENPGDKPGQRSRFTAKVDHETIHTNIVTSGHISRIQPAPSRKELLTYFYNALSNYVSCFQGTAIYNRAGIQNMLRVANSYFDDLDALLAGRLQTQNQLQIFRGMLDSVIDDLY